MNRISLSLVFSLLLGLMVNTSVLSQTYYGDLQLGFAPNILTYRNTDVGFDNPTVTPWVPIKITGSYGKGVNFGFNFGYFLKDYVAVELGINQFTGIVYNNGQGQYSGNIIGYLQQSNSGSMFKLCPAIKLTTCDGKVKPFDNNTAKNGGSAMDYYAKIGLDIGMINSITSNQTITEYLPQQQVYTSTFKYSGGTSIGMDLKLGMTFKHNDNLFYWAELTFVSNHYTPTSGEKTAYAVAGTNTLDSLTVSGRHLSFVDSQIIDPGQTNVPSQAQKTSYPFVSVGINVGIEYRIPHVPSPKKFKI